MSEKLKMRPYARLITMLGDQLIKNERIALAELIKNSYDADAEWVKVSFINFNDDFTINENSKIIIEDDGCGMNREIIEKHWLNPATPEKAERKQERLQTDKGRIIQGEKGIGRFAIFKLGKTIDIYTRRRLQDENGVFIDDAESVENIVSYDFSKYDENFIDCEKVQNAEISQKELFIDELDVDFKQQNPSRIKCETIVLGNVKKERKPYGTIIEISSLKTNWTKNRIESVQSDIEKLQPIFSEDGLEDFSVWIYKDGTIYGNPARNKEKLLDCLANKSVFKITNGIYHQTERKFVFEINGVKKELSFKDLNELKIFKEYFCDASGEGNVNYQTECGNFRFQFYIFDFDARDANYMLDKEESAMVKAHRIYLYRDNVRVLPYGDPDDDWLKIDTMRGTKSAGYYLSNDQVVGCVDITQIENPKLRDKTNREGLIDEGQAEQDFINLLQLILRYFRKIEYQKYLIDKRKRKEEDDRQSGKPMNQIQELRNKLAHDPDAQKLLSAFQNSYNHEQKMYEDRIEITQNLAAVGLSVETVSHDVMLILDKVIRELYFMEKVLKSDDEIDKESFLTQMRFVEDSLDFVRTQMQDIRLLFPAAKKRASNISVKDSIEKAYRLYKSTLEQNSIAVDIDFYDGDLYMKAVEAAMLQVFVNLFDNALYWLKQLDGDRAIKIVVDQKSQSVVFADNGAGVKDESIPYIFEAFYSEKGEDGRGLGLYITRQLLDRYNYDICLVTDNDEKLLPGANFCITPRRKP